jgi:TonB family protein
LTNTVRLISVRAVTSDTGHRYGDTSLCTSLRKRLGQTLVLWTLRLCATGIALLSAYSQPGEARFFGRLTNGNGTPISNAVIVLCNADAKLWFMTSTDGAGAFDFAQLPENRFSVEILSPQWRRAGIPGREQVWGYSPWADSITLQSRQSLQRNVQLGGLVQQPRISQTTPPCSAQSSTLTLGEEGLKALMTKGEIPVIPQSLRDADAQTEVTLEAFMNNEGRVISLRLLATSWPPTNDPLLTRAAVESVRDWRYTPPRPANDRYVVNGFSGRIRLNFAQ